MRFYAPRRKPLDIRKWHLWFAWYPIRVGETIFWLEYVWCRGEWRMCGYDQVIEWEYRDRSEDLN